MSTLLERVDDTQSIIEALTSKDEFIVDNDERAAFEDSFYTITSKAKKLRSYTSRISNPQAPQSAQPFSYIKLPDICLPSFSGPYKDWIFFKETFISVIDQHPHMPQSQKLNYLRMSLKGEPLHLIDTLEISDANYEIAWTILNDKYENIEKLINNQIKELFNLPVINKETHSSLSQLFDNTSRILKALEALNEPVQHWDSILVYLITTKLNSSAKHA
ncbi:uncharacterized protein [Diabrotica undecimpunctata]|uniref:uncharacterized protein n=1 Tax=Diabrotica undecimpunctata TaxID=50387 RepID=UPI003B63BFB2